MRCGRVGYQLVCPLQTGFPSLFSSLFSLLPSINSCRISSTVPRGGASYLGRVSGGVVCTVPVYVRVVSQCVCVSRPSVCACPVPVCVCVPSQCVCVSRPSVCACRTTT